ncbi:MAG: glycosyltransferase 2 family protein [Chloroflexota bacterium]|nr:glycosyltransferase 2 family protein [Chloroflexota bacterium]
MSGRDGGSQDDALIDYPLVNEDVEQGAVPLSQRLRSPRTIISLLLPLLILLLLLVALPGFELDRLPSLILNANPWLLLAAFAVYYAGFPLRGYRWTLLLRGAGYRVPARDSTEIIFISWLVNCLVPAKLGDVYRAYLLRQNFPVSLSKTFGTVFIERVFDLFAIVVLGLAAGFWSFRTGLTSEMQAVFAVGLVIVGLLTVGLFLIRNFGRRILLRLPLPHRIVTFYDRFEEGLFSIAPRQLPLLGIVTALIWATEATRLYLVVQALGFVDLNLGVSGAFFVALIASLLTAIPLAPAGLVVVEAGIVGVLVLFYDVPKTEAAAIALADRAISVLSVIVLGSIAYVLSSKTKARTPEPAAAGDRGS